MFAISIVAASTASATVQFHSEQENTTLTSTALSSQVLRIGPKEALICNKVLIDTTVAPKTVTEITVNPAYLECKIEANGSTLVPDISFGSCDYLFTVETATPPDGAHGAFHIKCTSGEIVINATILGKSVPCLEIPAQTPEGVMDYTNTGSGNMRDIDVKSTVEGIAYTKKGVCGEGTFKNGTYTGEITLTGENSKGEHVGIWVE